MMLIRFENHQKWWFRKLAEAAAVVFSDGGAHASFELGKGYYAKAFAFPKFKMELESFD